MATECTVPELGEKVDSATVVEVLVKQGDTIRLEQSVLSLETDKAAFEMPSNVEGTVAEILVKPGDDVKVGQVVLRVGAAAGDSAKQASPKKSDTPPPAEPAAKAERTRPATASAVARTSAGEKAASPPKKQAAPAPKPVPPRVEAEPATEAGEAEPAAEDVDAVEQESAEPQASEATTSDVPPRQGGRPSGAAVAAAPSVRRMARELGIEISHVHGSGPAGRVAASDLTAHLKAREAGQTARRTDAGGETSLPDFSRFGPVEVEPMSKVRVRTAEQMTRAWSSIPHVTHHDAADVTELEGLRRQYGKRVEKNGGKLTMTAVLLKVLGSALRKFPKFNASVDMAGHAIVYKRYVHIGVAVDTERGLLVPVIRDVDQKNIVEIALALREVSEKARNRNIKPDELQGASFTITNLGGIGGRAFSPLINPPEVAVLGVSSSRFEPLWTGSEFEARQILPLSVSYDHRVIDGADAARFLRWVCEALGEPFVMDLEGE